MLRVLEFKIMPPLPLPHYYSVFSVVCLISMSALCGCVDDAPRQPDARTVTEKDAVEAIEQDVETTPANSARAVAIEALRASIMAADAELEHPAPYQIQLTVDDSISFSIIGEKPDLDLNFENQDKEPINLATAYPGKILVLATIYTSCPLPDMCPRLTTDYAELAAAIPAILRDQVQLVLVSFDPQRDTPEVLKAYGQTHALDFEITDLVRGPIDQTQPLLEDALQIPLEVNPETNMIVTHAMMLHIIDRSGYIVVERTVSSSEPMELVAEEIKRAVLLPFDPVLVPAVDEESGKVITVEAEVVEGASDDGG